MQEVKKINLLSLAKIAGLFGILIGFIQGILMGQMSLQYARQGMILSFSEAFEYIMIDPSTGITPLFIALGWWSMIVAPILIGIGYLVSAIVLGWIYNIFSKFIGGIKIEFSEQKSKKKK